jgi:tetratricopeptide (TPR) repeat protein
MGTIPKAFFVLLVVSMIMVAFIGCKNPMVTSANIYLFQQNNPDKAEEVLKQALAQNPNDPEALYLMGKVYQAKEEYAKMADYFDRSLQVSEQFKADIEKSRDDVWTQLYNKDGVENVNSGDFAAAVKAMQLAAIVLPTRWETYSLMGIAYDGLDELDSSATSYKKAVELQPNEPEKKNYYVYYRLANILFREKKYEEANEYAMTVVNETKVDSLRLDAVEISARALSALDSSAAALKMYDEIIKSLPDDPDAYYDRALLQIELADTAAAINDFNRVLDLNPDDLDAMKHLASLYLEGGSFVDYAKALDYYQKINKIQPHEYLTVRGIIISLVRLGRADDAKAYQEEATQLLEKLQSQKKKE